MMHAIPYPSRRGMTLIELIVASLVVAAMTAATSMAVSQTLRTARASAAREAARSLAETAASRIAQDLASVTRDGDLYDVRVRIHDGLTQGTATDELLLLSRSASPARAYGPGGIGGEPESDIYEVQYRLAGGAQGRGGLSARRVLPDQLTAFTLWRRLDPAFDDYGDAGGIAFPIGQRLRSLSFEAFDGQRWFDTWDSDSDGMPHAVRLIVEAEIAARDPRDQTRRAIARRTIAMDRIPVPYVFLSPAERRAAREEEEASQGR